jgi:hypothetical protein
MNMANAHNSEHDFEYQANFDRRDSKDNDSAGKRRLRYARSSRAAVSHNGIHRRRNKRFTW